MRLQQRQRHQQQRLKPRRQNGPAAHGHPGVPQMHRRCPMTSCGRRPPRPHREPPLHRSRRQCSNASSLMRCHRRTHGKSVFRGVVSSGNLGLTCVLPFPHDAAIACASVFDGQDTVTNAKCLITMRRRHSVRKKGMPVCWIMDVPCYEYASVATLLSARRCGAGPPIRTSATASSVQRARQTVSMMRRPSRKLPDTCWSPACCGSTMPRREHAPPESRASCFGSCLRQLICRCGLAPQAVHI